MQIQETINTDTAEFRGWMDETNDCTVRAYAIAEGLDYQTARAIFRRALDRGHGRGVKENMLMNFLLDNGFENVPKMRNKTFKQALAELDPKETYYIVITGHAFTIRGGKLYGNREDSTRARKRVKIIFKK
jgi:hypothetical protein